MADYIKIFEKQMKKQAEAVVPAETSQEVDPVVAQQMEILSKYAELADSHLTEEYGENYTEDDVVKLAQMYIEHDATVEVEMQKEAEANQIGEAIARGFLNYLQNAENK